MKSTVHISAVMVILAFGTGSLVAQRGATKPEIDNDRVTVWNLVAGAAAVPAANRACVVIRLDESADVAFLPACSAASKAQTPSVVIELKDRKVPPLANTSGFPNAFPRQNAKKRLENDRVIVWDYTWATGVPTPMHFHDKDVVVIYLKSGAMRSTTPDGQSVVNELSPGLIRFNDRNRVHTEQLVKGESRAIITEFK
jgi:hypothetical protein